jgi:hypothetical protein
VSTAAKSLTQLKPMQSRKERNQVQQCFAVVSSAHWQRCVSTRVSRVSPCTLTSPHREISPEARAGAKQTYLLAAPRRDINADNCAPRLLNRTTLQLYQGLKAPACKVWKLNAPAGAPKFRSWRPGFSPPAAPSRRRAPRSGARARARRRIRTPGPRG